MNAKINLKFFLFILLFYQALFLVCDENEIENCDQCGSDENKGRCSKCEDKYFLVLNGEKCIACDNEFLGQEGCDGNCQFMKSEKNIFCEKCKDDFYYELSEGICAPCSYTFDNCLKCSYLKESEESEEKVFKCLECGESYYLSENECLMCDYNCKKCLDSTHCQICKDNYVLHPNGHCYSLNELCLEAEYTDEEYPKQICKKCKEGTFLGLNSNNCEYCNEDHTEKYGINLRGCQKCQIINDNQLICEKAYEYQNYNDDNIYSYCYDKIENCNKCSFHSEEDINDISKLICDKCKGDRYYSIADKTCKDCQIKDNGCLICSDGTPAENAKCDKCQEGYHLSSEGTCIKCSNLFGEGCSACAISPHDLSLYCSKCSKGFFLDYEGNCKHCVNDANLEGCEECGVSGNYNYYCLKCKENYILFENKCFEKNEQMSEFSFCEYLENIGSNSNIIFSCIECISPKYIFAIKSNGARICVDPLQYPELHNCGIAVKGDNDQNGYICSSCYYGISSSNPELQFVYDETLKKDICKCKEGYYEDSRKYYNYEQYGYNMCSFCSYEKYNCKACHDESGSVICDECKKGYILKDSGCDSISNYYCDELSKVDGSLNNECIKFREPYFLNKTNSKPESCLDYFDYCSKCSYKNSESSELKCEKCLDNYFLNKNGICEHCYINTNESPNCISCTDNEELKKNSPCQKCSENYFLTKENKCVFCKSEKYGGKHCGKCDYITINGVEKIGCIECDYNSWTVTTKEGKCSKEDSDEDGDNCGKSGYYFNKNDEKKFGCIECEDEYFLNEDHQCIMIEINNCMDVKIINGEQICIICYVGYELVENKCQKIKSQANSIIEGCSSYYYGIGNTIYCIKCESSYILANSFCYKMPNNPLLNDCTEFEIEKGLLTCKDCKSNSGYSFDYKYFKHYVNSVLMCGNKYFGYCYNLINNGTDLNPKYSCQNCSSSYIPVTDENGVIQCISETNFGDSRCLEGKLNTNYYKNIYTCSKCKSLYILSYSDYYEKNICKYL